MNFVSKELLKKQNIIKGFFDYREYAVNEEQFQIYSYFESSFLDLYGDYADLFNIKNCCFYIKDDPRCNAFAIKEEGYNIIGITNGYAINISKMMDKKHFESIVLAGINDDKLLKEAYIDLHHDKEFDFSKFFIDCSIKFTFNHEFQHIMQYNSSKFGKNNFHFQENYKKCDFDIQRHVREFDADRMGSFELLKYVFRVHANLKVKSDAKLKCLLYIGCSSMIITNYLFYLEVINQSETPLAVRKKEFYTKKYSHPHQLVRCINIMEYYFDNITNDLSRLKITPQELLNNTFKVAKLYFDSLLPGHDNISALFSDLNKHIDTINEYNGELYDLAIQDKAIRNLLLSRNIQFDDIHSVNGTNLNK
ncbi:hypothetical protein ABEY52_26830 [Priestia aryabhattai]|uniref:hypothetical protein n=1 Tax=Priestia aryabhattai TaxID=412384 RepID=UPI003D2E5D0E